jgi:hypothetical protein
MDVATSLGKAASDERIISSNNIDRRIIGLVSNCIALHEQGRSGNESSGLKQSYQRACTYSCRTLALQFGELSDCFRR